MVGRSGAWSSARPHRAGRRTPRGCSSPANRGRARSWPRRRSTGCRRAQAGRSSGSTAPPSRGTWSSPSCSGTRRAPSPGPRSAAAAASSWPAGARSSWTRSATSARRRRRSCCAPWRPASRARRRRRAHPRGRTGARRHQPGSRRRDRRGPVPRGPFLPPARRPPAPAAAAGPARRRAAAGGALPGAPPGPHRAHPAAPDAPPWRRSPGTPGRGTCASWRTSSSGSPSCTRVPRWGSRRSRRCWRGLPWARPLRRLPGRRPQIALRSAGRLRAVPLLRRWSRRRELAEAARRLKTDRANLYRRMRRLGIER